MNEQITSISSVRSNENIHVVISKQDFLTKFLVKCDFPFFETIIFRFKNNLISPDKKSVMMGPHSPLILSLIECANKGCINQYDRMCKSNLVLLTSFCNNWLMKLNVEIVF